MVARLFTSGLDITRSVNETCCRSVRNVRRKRSDRSRGASSKRTLGASSSRDVARLDPDLEWDSTLDVGDEEVGAFWNCLLLDPAESVKDDGSGSSWDVAADVYELVLLMCSGCCLTRAKLATPLRR